MRFSGHTVGAGVGRRERALRAHLLLWRAGAGRSAARDALFVALSFVGAGCARSVAGERDAAIPPAPIPRLAGCPAAPGPGRWVRLPDEGAPSPRAFAASAEVEGRLLVWGGQGVDGDHTDGALFDPASGRWEPMPEGPPGGDRRRLVVAPLAARVLAWATYERRGAIYDARVGRWTPVGDVGAPRFAQRAVGTSDGWFVWALGGAGEHNEVALLDPERALWRTTLAPLSQDARNLSAITWTGRQVMVWGGSEATFSTQPPRGDGVRYDPASDQWSSVESAGAPSPRWGPELFWTGAEALVWGGNNGSRQQWDGGLYDPIDDRWRPLPSAAGALRLADGAPTVEALAAWTGCSLFVWAGALPGSGPRAVLFDPFSSQWREAAPFPGTVAQEGVVVHAVGGDVVVWGGRRGDGPRRTVIGEGWLWTTAR